MDYPHLIKKYRELGRKRAVLRLEKYKYPDNTALDDAIECAEVQLQVIGVALYSLHQETIQATGNLDNK